MSYESYASMYQRACERKAGPEALESLLVKPLPTEQLAQLGDDRFLAQFTKSVFQSGFVWRVVREKWDAFEEIFWGFDVDKLLMMPAEMLERKAQDPRIIRHFGKVQSIIDNALMIQDVRAEHGSFARFVADWPEDNIIGLWEYLKKHGKRLGGNTGPYALRQLGKDTFILSRDVESYLRSHEVIDGGLMTKRSQQAAQALFNAWRQESGRSLTELSRLVAYGVGDNVVQAGR